MSAIDDLIKRTWQLFDAIARATLHRCLHRAVKQNNGPPGARPARQELADDNTFDELSALNQYWQQRDIPALRSALYDYHERRKQLVPCIVVLLSERRAQLH